MSTTEILFWVLSALTLGSALKVITTKSPVHSILWLILTFIGISGHFLIMNAQFLFIVNIIVYAGAIMVLFLFVVMMMNLNASLEPQKNRILQFAGVISGGALFLVIIAALVKSDAVNKGADMAGGNFGLVANLGHELFNTYVIPFEISSVLFLSAMVGAVVLSKKN